MKKKIFLIILIFIFIAFVCFVYIKYVSTKKLEVREYKIISSNLTSDYYGLKIVHFGDIHYGKNIDKKYLDSVVDKINLLKPDIVVFTGDLIDKNVSINEQIEDDILNSLSNIKSRLGKFAIRGDEDNDDYPSLIKKAGFTYLENNFEYIYNSEKPIIISNIDGNNLEDEKSIYNILLLHQPDKLLEMDYKKYNLVLAGHSHNGQIKLPFIGPLFKFNGSEKYYDSYYDLGNTKLYITSGIGTSKINIRFNNRPSFNIYRLVNK